MSPLLVLAPSVELINRFKFQIVPVLPVVRDAPALSRSGGICRLGVPCGMGGRTCPLGVPYGVPVFRRAAFASACLGW
jgi:hypothetical protein